jgi:hypothetical protein
MMIMIMIISTTLKSCRRADTVDVGAAMGLGYGLPLAPQQLYAAAAAVLWRVTHALPARYPHGYGAVRVLAGDRGETVG